MLPLLLTTLQFGSGPISIPPQSVAENRFHVIISLLAGDPLGSVEEKSITPIAIKEYSANSLQYLEFEVANALFPGSNGPKNVAVAATPIINSDGRSTVRLQVTLSQQINRPGAAPVNGNHEGWETSKILREGRPMRFRITSQQPHEQFWAEVMVKPILIAKTTDKKPELFEFKMGGVFGK